MGSGSGLSIKVGIAFSRIPLSPSHWTMITLIPAVLAAYYIAQNAFLYAAILMIIYAFIDLVDGSVARVRGRATLSGAYLDSVVKRYAEFILATGLTLAALPVFVFPAYVWIVAFLFGTLMAVFVKSAANQYMDTDMKTGFEGRPLRFILLFIGVIAAVFEPLYLVYILALLAFLTNISALQRIAKAGKKR